jgi:multiple sugar transport system ATP-binding protein
VREPRIFLFDEPLSNLDAELRVQMRVEIAKLHNDLGNTMIYVTHDQVEAMTMADKIVVLNAGVIEQAGAPLELYNTPRNRFVAGFIGSPKMNFLEARVGAAGTDGARLQAGSASIDLPRPLGRASPGDPVSFGVRPEHISLAEGSGVRLAEVRVDLVEQLGAATMLYTSTADQQGLTIAVNGQQRIAIGDRVTAYVDPARYHVFGADGLAL